MKTNKWVIFGGLTLFIFCLTACGGGGGKYADVKSVMKKVGEETDKFVAAMDKADNGEKVAAAMTDFAETMGEMRTELEELIKKYPELEDMENPPEELAEEAQAFMGSWSKIMSAMMKIQQYADDPAVLEAQKKFDEVMK